MKKRSPSEPEIIGLPADIVQDFDRMKEIILMGLSILCIYPFDVIKLGKNYF